MVSLHAASDAHHLGAGEPGGAGDASGQAGGEPGDGDGPQVRLGRRPDLPPARRKCSEPLIGLRVDRNAQIADLQQKVLVADGEGRLKQRIDGITSIVEAKSALRVLMAEVKKRFLKK